MMDPQRRGRRAPVRRARAAASALVIAGLAGCAATPAAAPGAQPATPPSGFPVITSWKQVHRPLEKYLPTADQQVALTRLSFATETRCIVAHGYRTSNTEPADYPAFVRGLDRDRIVRSDTYGFFDTDTVAEYGYLRPPNVPEHVMLVPPAGVPDAVFQACEAEGARLIEPAADDRLPLGGPPQAGADARVAAARTQWRSCMSDHGFDVADPIAAISDHQSSSAADRSVAVSDVICKQQTNLVGIATGVQSSLDDAYIRAHRTALESYAATVAALTARAARAAGAGS